MSVLQVAAARMRRQKALARRAAAEVVRLWARIDRSSIRSSWLGSLAAALAVVSSAQAIAAAGAGPYLDDLAQEYGLPDESAGTIRVDAFAGIASDGRPLETLLFEPAIAALKALKGGRTPPQAVATGGFALDMIVRTQVADAGRVATGVALTARPSFTGYVRMLTPPSCSRCAILAGRRYRWNAGFDRHPRCDCIAIPAPEDAPDDLRTDPRAYFDSLPAAEQDRVFTKAGAQAIREGGDIARVVNARRGMQSASIGGQNVLVTTEAAGRRPRLMPESIFAASGGDREQAIRLLKLHGFIL